MQRLFGKAWAIIQAVCVLIVIVYLYRSSWFGPTRRFLITPEIMEENEDQGDDSKTWVSKDVKGSELGESDYFTDGFGATFVIRPQSSGSNEDE